MRTFVVEIMRPLKFRPIFKQTLWGGGRILPYKGMDGTLAHVGESWELSGVAGAHSVVAEGVLEGCTLPELIDRFGAALVGENNHTHFGREFPLLIKFIDAQQDLSIQVHPGDELARKRHGKRGKTEMWYVIDADPGTTLISGFAREITPDQYDRRVADGTLPEVLAHHAVAAGDVFYLPAGQVHSIGRGALIAEIQQPSDVTYRISDFGRVDGEGRPRELHTELAREAIHYKAEGGRVDYRRVLDRKIPLVESPSFTTSLYESTRPMRIEPCGSFLAMIFLGGEGVLKDNEGNEIVVRRGETLLIPASTRWIEVVPGSGGRLKFLTAKT